MRYYQQVFTNHGGAISTRSFVQKKYFIIQKDLVMKLRMACLSKYFLRESIPIKIMKIFSFFAANIKYGGGIVSHLPLCLRSIRRSHVILMAGENNLLLVSFILNLSNRIWSTLPKPLLFCRIAVQMYFLGVSAGSQGEGTSASVGNALPPVGAPSMLCWAHRSHSWNNCRQLCCRKPCIIPQHLAF